ncbi:MAG: ABC transporter permease [Thermoplasmatota archaeon]
MGPAAPKSTPATSGMLPPRQQVQPPPSFLHSTLEVARKEVLQHIRTKRLFIIVPIFVVVMVLVTVVVPGQILKHSTLNGGFLPGTANQNIAMLFFFSGFFVLSGYFYLQLLSLVLTTDAVSSEWSSRTLFLLLSKPVSRRAMVLGKFIGSTATVLIVVAVTVFLDYVVAGAALPGGVSGESWGRFMGALGILLLGCTAFCAAGLFFSTLTRSAVTGLLLAMAAWIFVFPLLGTLDQLLDISNNGLEALVNPSPSVGWSVYLSPTSSMRVASNVMAPSVQGDATTNFFARLFGFTAPGDPGGAALALLVHAATFLGLALWVVDRRNFE